jgi:subtilisin family serine protease
VFPNRILVKFSRGHPRRALAEGIASEGMSLRGDIGNLDWEVVEFESIRLTEATERALRVPGVVQAVPDYIRVPKMWFSKPPDDPLYLKTCQWESRNEGQGWIDPNICPWPIFASSTPDADTDAYEAWQYVMHPSWSSVRVALRQTTIAVVDSGLDLEHPELVPKIRGSIVRFHEGLASQFEGWEDPHCENYLDAYDLANLPFGEDCYGHGTAMALIAGAQPNNGEGMTGTGLWAPILNVKVCAAMDLNPAPWSSAGAICPSSAIASGISQAMEWCEQNGCPHIVFSMSLGSFTEDCRRSDNRLICNQYSPLEADAIRDAYARGALFVGDAGNDGLNREEIGNRRGPEVPGATGGIYPGNYPEVITVGATDSEDWVWGREEGLQSSCGPGASNWGSDWVEVAAPGVNIFTVPATHRTTMAPTQVYHPGVWYSEHVVCGSGTSNATPQVAAQAALIWGMCPGATNQAVKEMIFSTAEPRGVRGTWYDRDWRYGRINILAAVQSAETDVTIRTPKDGERVFGTIPVVVVSEHPCYPIERFELYIDDTLLATATSNPATFYWDTMTATEGVHYLRAVAILSGAGSATSRLTAVTVDNASPLLTTSVNPRGAGVVMGFPPGIRCEPDCEERYAQGTLAYLGALRVHERAYFSNWSGDCAPFSGPAASVMMDDDRYCGAWFATGAPSEEWFFVVFVDGRGTARVSIPTGYDDCRTACSYRLPRTSGVGLTPYPDQGERFLGYSGVCPPFFPGRDHWDTVCVVHFTGGYGPLGEGEEFLPEFTLYVDHHGNGTVTAERISCGDDCSEDYAIGTSVSVSATADPYWEFDYWEGDCATSAVVLMNRNRYCHAVFSRYAYPGEANIMVILDISDPQLPFFVSTVALPGPVWRLTHTLASVGTGIWRVSWSTHDNPFVSGGSSAIPAHDTAFRSGYSHIYVAAGERGLVLLNSSDFSIVGEHDTPGFASGVFALGSYAYIADGASGLSIFDTSNPGSPVIIGSIDWDQQYFANDVIVVGDYAYVADDLGGLAVVNVQNPASPVLQTVLPADENGEIVAGQVQNLQVDGKYLFAASGMQGLRVFSLQDPTNPAPIGQHYPGVTALGVSVSGRYCYIVGPGQTGLRILDIIDPENPTLISQYAGSFKDLWVSGQVLENG